MKAQFIELQGNPRALSQDEHALISEFVAALKAQDFSQFNRQAEQACRILNERAQGEFIGHSPANFNTAFGIWNKSMRFEGRPECLQTATGTFENLLTKCAP